MIKNLKLYLFNLIFFIAKDQLNIYKIFILKIYI